MSALPFSDPTGQIADYANTNFIQLSDPQIGAAIASVQQAAANEGFPITSQESFNRVGTLLGSYKQIYDKLSEGGGPLNATQTAISAARQYVGQNSELGGALATTSGLVNAFANAAKSGQASPVQLAADVSGPVIATLVTAGALSAGVGAAVIAGLAILDSLMDAGADKPGFQVCPGFELTTPTAPDYAVGCIAVFAPNDPITPNSVNWRRFPEPINPADAWWFAKMNATSNPFVDWPSGANKARWIADRDALAGGTIWVRNTSGALISQTGGAPIDSAFPAYRAVVTMAPTFVGQSTEQAAAVKAFSQAFVTAWKANAEYWLNGRKGADDSIVLQHVAELWNRAHLPGVGVDIAPNTGNLYWTSRIPTVVNSIAPGDPILSPDGAKLHLYTGALRSTKPTVAAKPTPKPVPATTVKPLVQIGPSAAQVAAQIAAAQSAALQGQQGVPLWQRIVALLPAALGIASIPWTGYWGPLSGVAGTAAWLEAQNKGWIK